MNQKTPFWYRLRYAFAMWRRLDWDSWSFAWASANATDAEFLDDLTPKEAVDAEISCWDDDGEDDKREERG